MALVAASRLRFPTRQLTSRGHWLISPSYAPTVFSLRQCGSAKEEITETEAEASTVPVRTETAKPAIKKKRKRNELLSDQEKGKEEIVTMRTLYHNFIDRFGRQKPDELRGPDANIHDKYTLKDEIVDKLVKLKIIEPRGDWKAREKTAMVKKGGLQTNLGNEKIGRAMNSAGQVKRKYGAKKRATKEYLYTEVHKYYKVFGGLMTMRHWRVEKWLGVPVKMWIFVYLCVAGIFVFSVTYWFNTPRLVDEDPKVKENDTTSHIPLVLEKLRTNNRLREELGNITNAKLTKLPPADRNNFRARFVHEIWADSEKEGVCRIVLVYDTEQSLDGLCRMEVHLDEEIIKIDFDEDSDGTRDLDKLIVIRCPPDLFPLAHWFTQSRREVFAYIPYYVWPIAPLGCLMALARWHYRSPPGLANYVLDQLKSHVIVRRTLGSPVHLQSDQWKGRLNMRSCNMRVLLAGTKHTGKVSVVGYRDGSTRWLFPNSVLMIDGVKHDHYREIYIPPFEIPTHSK